MWLGIFVLVGQGLIFLNSKNNNLMRFPNKDKYNLSIVQPFLAKVYLISALFLAICQISSVYFIKWLNIVGFVIWLTLILVSYIYVFKNSRFKKQ